MKLLNKHIKTILLAFSLFTAFHVFSQIKQPKTRILFLFDASQSMLGQWEGEQKIKVATRLLSNLMDSLKPIKNMEVGLRIYGHQFSVAQGNRSCQDSKLEVPFKPNNYNAIKAKLSNIYPIGTTPIAYSLEQTKNDFSPCDNCKNIIILITDGKEECGGDPCAIALALKENGVTLKPFVIGMGLDVEIADAFKCVGNYYGADDASSFENVLGIIIKQIMNNTTVQVNLLDQNGLPTETDVNMTFYNSYTKQIEYNFIHTINHRGNPDTIPLNHANEYDLVVHTLPPVSKKNITITPGIHNVIALDAPQGYLEMEMNGFNEYKDLKCIVRKKGSDKTFHIQDFSKKTKYIVGDYDLEILTLPKTEVNNINIKQSHTTKVFIPEPGLGIFFLPSSGIASILLEKDNKLEWIYNISPNTDRETIVLQPGNYRLVYRGKNIKNVIYTKEKSFKITSGASTQVRL